MSFLIAVIVILVIIAVVSTVKDEECKSGLAKKLKTLGYSIDEKLDLPDINKENHPYCFMVDKKNKKWFLTLYRAEDAKAYDYSDIIYYSITYREIGNLILQGDEHNYSYSQIAQGKAPFLTQFDLNKENCEYLEFTLTYSQKAKSAGLCDSFVMYKQRTPAFTNHDYVVPSVCFMNAADFEKLLYEIMCENTNKQYKEETEIKL